MVFSLYGARNICGHFKQRVWERFGLTLSEGDLQWILEQIKQPEYPTLIRLKEEDASQIHMVQLKREPGVDPLGYVVVGPRKGALCFLTAYHFHKWPGDGKDDHQRRRDYARALKRIKEWKR